MCRVVFSTAPGQPLEDPSHCSRAPYSQRLDDAASSRDDARGGRGGASLDGVDSAPAASTSGGAGGGAARRRVSSRGVSFGGVGQVDPFKGSKLADDDEVRNAIMQCNAMQCNAMQCNAM